MAIDDNQRPLEADIHTDLAGRVTYGGYLQLQLLLSARERRPLHAALDAAVPALHDLPEARKVRWSLDVDPVELY